MVTGHGYKDMTTYRGMPCRVRHLGSVPDDAELAQLLANEAAARNGRHSC